MTVRHFVYRKLANYLPLTLLIGGPTNPRIFTKKGMTSSIEDHPFVVYKLGHFANEELAEDTFTGRQYVQIWVHDYHDGKVADYDRIDFVLEQVKNALHGDGSGEDGVYMAVHIETSQDFNDETLNTIFKYHRFHIIQEG